MKPVIDEMRRAMQEAIDQLQLADAELLRLSQTRDIEVAPIRGGIEQAANRLERALMLQRVLGGEMNVTLLPTPVGDLIDDALAQAASLVQRADVRFIAVDDSEGYWMLDREIVREMLFNAAANAMLHQAGEVRIRAHGEAGWLLFDVEDDGPGFPSLDPAYYRARGFGLELAQTCAENHRRQGRSGSIELGVSPLGGGRFRIRLP